MTVKEGKGEAAHEEGEDAVGDLVDRQVFTDIPLRGFPQEGAFGGIELDQKGAVALGGSVGGLVRDSFV